MEVKPGYKQTEVGVIPNDWEPTPLRDACTLHNGRAYGLHEWERSGVPVIRLQNLTGGEDYYYSTLPLPESKYCDYGDLLYMWSATFGPRFWLGGRAIYHYHIWKVAPREGRATKEFLYYKLLEITDEKKARATNGGTMLHVTKTSMEATDVALPPLPEQRAVAAALSDVDALLGGLDQLIAKKRDLKQAAMQQLLTGQTRLPGFQDEWEEIPIKELFKISAGGDVNSKLSSSARDGIYCFPIYSNALTDDGLYGYCSYADHPAGSITVTARGTLGVATYRDHKYTAIGRVLVLEPKRPTAGRFFAESINDRVKFAIESTGVPQLTAPQISTLLSFRSTLSRTNRRRRGAYGYGRGVVGIGKST
jgi:restriction endonuclease S subunit